jgi:hypothetical protein
MNVTCISLSHKASDRKERVKEAKSIEPKGKPSDQYWVQYVDGGVRVYPLGTIQNNFERVWRVDANGWPYLVEV